MKLLFTICARKGSKGLKNKNISNFLDYPICYYTLSAYQLFKDKYGFECELAVNTDSEELINQIKKTCIIFKHIQRTDELAGDRVGKIDVIKDTYKKMNKEFDYIIDLDLTSPLRTVEDIKGVLDKLTENSNADASFSMTNSRRSPYFNQVCKNEKGFFEVVNNLGFTSRQQAPEIFDMNASIYAYRPNYLLDNNVKKLFDGKLTAYQMKDTAILDIDNPEDKEMMEIIARYFYKEYDEYNQIYNNIRYILKP